MPARPLNLPAARNLVQHLPNPALRLQLEETLAALTARFTGAGRRPPAADFDLLFLVEVLAEIGARNEPQELEFPEQVLRPLDDELALSLATPSDEEAYSFFDHPELFED
jgi:hypothetical protein